MNRWLRVILITIFVMAGGCFTEIFHSSASAQMIKAQAEVAVTTSTGCKPVKIALWYDRTASANQTRTPSLTKADFAPLINTLTKCGGELSFAVVSDASNKGLLRLRIARPPVKPLKPDGSGNPFRAAEKRTAYDKGLSQFMDAYATWSSNTEKHIHEFLIRLEPLLSLKANAKTSDIAGALNRTRLFINEDENIWEESCTHFIVFISDCLDTAKKGALDTQNIRSSIWIVVNGEGQLGVLSALNPKLFEASESAFLFISNNVKGG